MLTFGDNVVDESHREAEHDEISEMVDKTMKAVHDVYLLSLVALIEGYFFAVCDQASVHVSEFSLITLFSDSHLSNGLSQQSQTESRYEEIEQHDSWSLSADGVGQLDCIDEDIQNGLKSENSLPFTAIFRAQTVSQTQSYFAQVGVEFGERVAELFNVLCEQLVSIGDSVVQVAHLVICQIAEVHHSKQLVSSKSKSDQTNQSSYLRYLVYKCLVSRVRNLNLSSSKPYLKAETWKILRAR